VTGTVFADIYTSGLAVASSPAEVLERPRRSPLGSGLARPLRVGAARLSRSEALERRPGGHSARAVQGLTLRGSHSCAVRRFAGSRPKTRVTVGRPAACQEPRPGGAAECIRTADRDGATICSFVAQSRPATVSCPISATATARNQVTLPRCHGPGGPHGVTGSACARRLRLAEPSGRRVHRDWGSACTDDRGRDRRSPSYESGDGWLRGRAHPNAPKDGERRQPRDRRSPSWPGVCDSRLGGIGSAKHVHNRLSPAAQ
jgi:hypothetical protein